jgi:hypothetical protein
MPGKYDSLKGYPALAPDDKCLVDNHTEDTIWQMKMTDKARLSLSKFSHEKFYPKFADKYAEEKFADYMRAEWSDPAKVQLLRDNEAKANARAAARGESPRLPCDRPKFPVLP